MNQPRTIKWLLPIGLALSPLIIWEGLMDREQSIRYLYLIIFGASATTILWIACKKKIAEILPGIFHFKNPFFICAVIWVAATISSLNVSIQKSEAYVEIARVAFFLLSYLWVSIWVKVDSRNVLWLSIGFCFTGFLLSCIGIKDFYGSWSLISSGESYFRMMGNIGNRNLLAIMLSLCLPFHFIVFENYKSRLVRLGLLINFLFVISVIILTTSRVGWLGLLVLFFISAVGIIAGYFRGDIDKNLFRKLTAASASCLIGFVIIVSVLLWKNPAVAENISQRLKSFYNFSTETNVHTESINERFRLWSNTVELIKEHPLAGLGAGNWKFRYPEKGLTGKASQGIVLYQQPHNDFLWVFSETGAMGGLAFTSLFVIAIVSVFRVSRLLFRQRRTEGFVQPQTPSSSASTYSVHIAILCGISMYAVHSFFDFPKERPLILFTFAGMLAIATSFNEKKNAKAFSIKKTRLLLSVMLAVSIVTMWLWLIRMQGEIALKKALTAREEHNYNRMNKYFDKLPVTFFESDLTGTPIAWYRGEAAFRLGKLDESKSYFGDALKLSPFHLYSHYNLGAIYYYQGDISAAIQCWEKALSIAPNFSDACLNLSSAYFNQGNFQKAAGVLSKAKIDYSDKSNSLTVTTVLRQFISIATDTVTNPNMLSAIQIISANDDSLKNLQRRMFLKGESPGNAIFNQTIEIAVKSQAINEDEAKRLRAIY